MHPHGPARVVPVGLAVPNVHTGAVLGGARSHGIGKLNWLDPAPLGLPNRTLRHDWPLVQVSRLLVSNPPEGKGAGHKLHGLHQHVVRLGRRRSHKACPPSGGPLEPDPAFVLHAPTVRRPRSQSIEAKEAKR